MTNKKLIIYFIDKYFKKDFIIFALFSLLTATVSAPVPFIYKKVINEINSASLDKLLILSLFYVFLLTTNVLLNYLKERKTASFQYDVSFTVSAGIYERVLKLPFSVLSEKAPGDIMKLVQTDSNNLYNIITYGILQIMSIAVQFIVNFSILIYLFGWKVIFILIVLPVYFILIRKGADNVENYGFKYEQSVDNWAEDAYSPLYKLKEVKSRRIEGYLTERIKKSYSEVRKAGVKYGYVSNLLYSFYSFFDKGIYASIFLFGIYSVNTGKMSLGSLFAIIYVADSVMSGFNDFSLAIINDFQKRLPSITRIADLFSLEIPESLKSPDTAKPVKINFSNVRFSYGKSSATLEIDNLNLKSGLNYVLLGETGSGKSTFFDLINGIRFPQEGSITINGISTKDITHSWWKNNVFVLLQDSTVFRGNLLENILMDDIVKGEDHVKNIIDKNGFKDFFSRFKNGLLTEPKEGNALSGGEKRMINIIRLLLKQNCIIVLIDEGKTGLDASLRKKTDTLLEKKPENRLSVTITHDLDEIGNFDEIIFIKNGKVIKGKHDDLYADNADYKNFITNGGNDH